MDGGKVPVTMLVLHVYDTVFKSSGMNALPAYLALVCFLHSFVTSLGATTLSIGEQ